MDKGKEIYKNIIDTLVDKSKSCVSADCAISGKAKGNFEDTEKLNEIFSKLSTDERKVLAQYLLETYADGIYDALCEIEWYIDCKNMKITVEGEELPTTAFEGLGNDFIGRINGWEWSE